MSLLHALRRLDLLKRNRAVRANNLFVDPNSLMIHHDLTGDAAFEGVKAARNVCTCVKG